MKIGIADTTFSRVDMFSIAEDTIKRANKKAQITRYTVPGIKDLPIACKRLFEFYGCDIVIALGMVGAMPVDKVCGHEASLGIQNVMLQESKHILEVFIHMDEAKDDKDLFIISKNRASKHALNALELMKSKTALSKSAGTGKRQGRDDVGPVKIK